MSLRDQIARLRTRREAIGATLDEVADKSGLNRSTINRHEMGRIAKITRVNLRAWECALDDLEREKKRTA